MTGKSLIAAGWVVTTWLVSVPVLAQDELGDGTRLDASLQQGAGGKNAPQRPIDFAGRNALITGNVPGLGYFHEDVGYGAPEEFRDELSDDALFRFRARSLPPYAPDQPGDSYLGQPVTRVYRSQAPTAAGEAMQGGYLIRDPERAGLVVRRPFVTAPTPIVVPTPGLTVAPGGTGYNDDLLSSMGVLRLPTGQLTQLRASPLLGVRQTPLEGVAPGAAPSGYPAPAAPTPPGAEPQDRRSLPAENIGEQMRVKSGLLGTEPSPAPTVTPLIQPPPSGLPSPPETEPGQEEPADQGAPETLVPGLTADPYAQVLEEVRQRRESLSAPTSPTPVPQPGAGGEADRSGAAGGAGTTPFEEEPGRGYTTEQLLQMLDYDLPRIRTLIGSGDAWINDLSQRAQEDLEAGRYLSAESKYLQLVRMIPDRPLGMVGLVHSQIGAGMILSASVNLRRMLDRHPELIAAKYELQLLPDEDRLGRVRQELANMLKHGNDPAPALLLAYIAYQTDDRGVARAALEVARSRAPEDPMIELVSSIWLGGEADRVSTEDAGRAFGGEGPLATK
jgi:hypothetical protein